MALSKLEDLVNPQVMADLMEKKLVNAQRFAPLCDITYELQGRPGDTVTVPYYNYIGDAAVVGEGCDVTINQLTASTKTATIHKLANAVELSDEAANSGFGDPVGQAADQLALSIASARDTEVLNVLDAITGEMLYETSGSNVALEPADINKALELFGEDVDGEKVLVCAPALATKLRSTKEWIPASEIGADAIIKGVVGSAYGCQIFTSNKLKTSGSAYIVKPGALRIAMKKDIEVEAQRELEKFCTLIAASAHHICYLYDESKAVKLAKKSS